MTLLNVHEKSNKQFEKKTIVNEIISFKKQKYLYKSSYFFCLLPLSWTFFSLVYGTYTANVANS